MPTKIIKLFRTTKKHDIVRSRSEKYILEHGAANCAKTLNRCAWALEICSQYAFAIVYIFRSTSNQIADSIFPVFLTILQKNPVWSDANVSKIDRTRKKILLNNGSEIRTGEINKKSDPQLDKIKTSLNLTTAILDDCASYLDQDVFQAISKNIGKVSSYNEIELHSMLSRQKLLKSRLLEYKGNIEFQKILFTENRAALEPLPDGLQRKILEAYAMPCQIIMTNNPTSTGFWYSTIYQKCKRGEPNYFEQNYQWDDNKEYLSDAQIDYFLELEKEGGQYWEIFGRGLPILTSDPLDLYSPDMIAKCYDLGKDIKKNQFFDENGDVNSNYVCKGGLDPAELGPDTAAICAPIFEDKKTGIHYVFGFGHSKEGAVDSDWFRDVIPSLLKFEKIKPQNFAVDYQGTKVAYYLMKDGCAIQPFKQAKCGAIELNKGWECHDLRAEVFWYLRQLMLQEKLYFCFPRHRELDEQLLMLRRQFMETGMIKLVRKEVLRKLFGTSSDFPDSLAMGCAANKIKRKNKPAKAMFF